MLNEVRNEDKVKDPKIEIRSDVTMEYTERANSQMKYEIVSEWRSRYTKRS